MMGSYYLIKLQPLSLSNDTIRRRIQDVAYDILSQAVDEIKSCPNGMFGIQLDESTDVTQLLVYVRYVYNDDIKLRFCCANLWKLQRLQEIFSKLCRTFFEEHGIEWKNLCAVCTDGAPAMLGCRSGFQAFLLGEFLTSTLLYFQFLIRF
jgi:hypothetical protein